MRAASLVCSSGPPTTMYLMAHNALHVKGWFVCMCGSTQGTVQWCSMSSTDGHAIKWIQHVELYIARMSASVVVVWSVRTMMSAMCACCTEYLVAMAVLVVVHVKQPVVHHCIVLS